MGRVVTQSDVDGVPAGGTLAVAPDANVTPLAEERARQRGVRIERRGSGGHDERELVRAVTRAVVSRMGNAAPAVVETVVGEVMSAISGGGAGGSSAQPPSTAAAALRGAPSPLAAPASPSLVTTPRGAQLLPMAGATPTVDYCLACVEQEKSRKRSRAVLTTTGGNSKGIVALITARIAELGGDVLDISQTLVSDFFTMIIVIDVGSLSVPFERFQQEVTGSVKQLGCHAMMMHEDVLTSLHRV